MFILCRTSCIDTHRVPNPLSAQVDENMKRAHIKDAVRTQKFHFRKHIAPPAEDQELINSSSAPPTPTPPLPPSSPVQSPPPKFGPTSSQPSMSNTEREMAAAIAAEVAGSPCGPCNAKVSKLLFK